MVGVGFALLCIALRDIYQSNYFAGVRLDILSVERRRARGKLRLPRPEKYILYLD